MSKIYVVMGTTGEYSDRSEWPVKAFREKPAAEHFIVQATNEAHFLAQLAPRAISTFDPDFRLDRSTGTSYFHHEVELQ